MIALKDLVESTALHAFLLDNYGLLLPAIQSTHIVAVGVVIIAQIMVVLRILGKAGTDLPLTTIVRTYGRWLWGGLILLGLTGLLMIFTEPGREFLDPSKPASEEYVNWPFWLKMMLLVVGIAISCIFQSHLQKNSLFWEAEGALTFPKKAAAVAVLLLWFVIMFLGRMIAYPSVLFG